MSNTIYLDIYLRGRFYHQLPYTFRPLFAIDSDELTAYVLNKLPTIKDKPFTIHFSNNKLL